MAAPTRHRANGVGTRAGMVISVIITCVIVLLVIPPLLTWVSVATQEPTAAIESLVALSVIGSTVIAIFAFRRARNRGERTALLHPLVAPLAYIIYALLVPQAYMLLTGRGIGSIPNDSLTVATAQVMALTVLGYVVGAIFGLSAYRPRRQANLDAPSQVLLSAKQIADSGRAILLISLAAKVYQVLTSGTVFTSTYGSGQLAYDETTAIAVAGEALVAVGCLALMYGNSSTWGRPLRGLDWPILGAVLFTSTVLLGSRGEAIAPLVLFLWFRLQFGKPIRVFAILVVGALTAVLFAAVSSFRSASSVRYPFFEEFLWQTSSPQLLTSVVTSRVPSVWPFFEGETYLNALRYFLPGPISRSLFGDVQGTGSLVYREIAGVTSDSQGYGFALPTEAYLNFGNMGVFIVALLLGGIVGFAYKWANDPNRSFRLSSFIYPLVISYLPYGLRSDFLGQFKSIIYPLIILGVLIFLSNTLARTFGRRGATDRAAPGPQSSRSGSPSQAVR